MIKKGIFSPKDPLPIILYLVVILFYILYQLIMQPHWMLDGEMWAEMATNYFPSANSSSYLIKLFSTDSGYIPAPQRIIAFIGNLLHLHASTVPYFYTWSAIILTALLVSVFCLAPFRCLIKNDALRFLAAIAILMSADFETKTFINFTYFAAFFITVITALAWVDKLKPVSKWAWVIPILIISKPAVLATLPAMIIVAITRESRFRHITIVTFFLCIGQVIQMKMSQPLSGFVAAHDINLSIKVITACKYFFGILAHCLLGPNLHFNKNFSILFGIIIFLSCSYLMFKRKNNANTLIVIGFSLLFFNTLLNTFALSDTWNRHVTQLAEMRLQRHIIVGYFGCILIIVSLIDALTKTWQKKNAVTNIGAIIFMAWFVGTGWLSFSEKNSKEPASPAIHNSQWQNMSTNIDLSTSPLCVPIDPLGWIYSKNCAFLNTMPNWNYGTHVINTSITLKPRNFLNKTLVATAFLIKPLSNKKTFIRAEMTITLKNGHIEYASGEKNIMPSGGLILLTEKNMIVIQDIAAIKVRFSSSLEMANNPMGNLGVIWMGV